TRNPDDFFADLEQAAFEPANLVPGIEPSPDKMLLGRLFTYPATHPHPTAPRTAQPPRSCPSTSRRCRSTRTARTGPCGTGTPAIPCTRPTATAAPRPTPSATGRSGTTRWPPLCSAAPPP